MSVLTRFFSLVVLVFGAVWMVADGAIAKPVITIQSTTTIRDSGLFDFLLKKFAAHSDISVLVVTSGTGQAIRNAQDCNGDVLFVHSREDEQKFVEAGFSKKRFDVMYNDFVIVGPSDDPARIKGIGNLAEALKKIAGGGYPFVSRADDSGTHKTEMKLWAATLFDPKPYSGTWYLETGSGMGKTLNVAIGKNAYVLTDRSTWVKYGNKENSVILSEGVPPLINQYGAMVVSSERCPNVDTASAEIFVDWLISQDGQNAIADYKIDGVQLFFPNAVVTK